MNRSIKVALLVVTLALPALIFIFLKLFGENTFEVPIYHTNGVDQNVEGCSFPSGQYHVDPSQMPEEARLQGKISVVAFVADRKVLNQLDRVDQSFSHKSLQILNICDSTTITELGGGSSGSLRQLYLNSHKHRQLIRCGFVAENDRQLVLVDQLSRIRGYYLAEDWEEIDRLILEIKILLYGTANGA